MHASLNDSRFVNSLETEVMTVVDDLTMLASLLPPPMKAKYQVQLVWAADANKDIGFRISLCEDFNNRNKKEYRDLQLRDFNLAFILHPVKGSYSTSP